MSRKDYILIAEALRIQRNRLSVGLVNDALGRIALSEQTSRGIAVNVVDIVASELADSLRRDNPRFDTEHFLAVVRGDKELNSRPSRNGGR